MTAPDTQLAGGVATDPSDLDPRLRGRTYAIPFDRVWQAAVALAGGHLRGWSLVEADDYEGVIRAESKTLLGAIDDVRITIVLDPDAQTRVDAQSAARKPRRSNSAHVRRIDHFFRALDRAVHTTAGARRH